MSRIRRAPRILNEYQIKRAIKEGKKPFLVWKNNKSSEFGPHNKRVFWSPTLDHCFDNYPEHKGWICQETSVEIARTMTGV